MSFDKNVFINCPFDDEYVMLVRPLVFTILYLEFEPLISQTKSSSNIRINQIKQHIRNSKFGIHDLSRSKAIEKNELPRLNMPYELGLDIGCAEYGENKLKQKKTLILESEKYHYQKVILDIAGQDISAHHNDPEILVKRIRDWFSTIDEEKVYPGSVEIWQFYNRFLKHLIHRKKKLKFTVRELEELIIGDFIKLAKKWLTSIKKKPEQLHLLHHLINHRRALSYSHTHGSQSILSTAPFHFMQKCS